MARPPRKGSRLVALRRLNARELGQTATRTIHIAVVRPGHRERGAAGEGEARAEMKNGLEQRMSRIHEPTRLIRGYVLDLGRRLYS